ncbi:MAG: hypothetical protein CLLPBCKN_005343 [Chroococcidiopsis cubana SAG 39.79]|jgi:UDP-N-acetylmuramoylalanine-D-glutamate ligase|nr:hypothetical protein [Chroococcidiopsis cubana SAG 39.79]
MRTKRILRNTILGLSKSGVSTARLLDKEKSHLSRVDIAPLHLDFF